MSKPGRFLWLAAILALTSVEAAADLPPLIPREVLFSSPERGRPRLSPDGRRLAYLKRSPKGQMLIWIRSLESGDSAAVTSDDQPEAAGYFWGPDGTQLLFVRDTDGDENFHLFALDLASRAVRDLTPYPGVRSEVVAVNPRHPKEILIGLNLRDRKVLDVHRLNLETGQVELDTENPGDVTEWTADRDLQIRGATALDAKDASTILRVRDTPKGPWRDLVRWPFEQAGNDRYRRILGFVSNDRELLVQTPIGASTTRLVAMDVASGKEREVCPADPRGDIWNPLSAASSWDPVVLRDRRTGGVQAVAVNGQMPEWNVVDVSLAPDFERLRALHKGTFVISSRDTADRRWVVAYAVDDGPGAFYLYDRSRRTARFLFYEKPQLVGLKLAPMKPVTVRAHDGQQVPCYLTLPVGVPPKGLPMVAVVHGGPWYRDEWGFDPGVQLLANRGYAVLQVNFRASSGFGQTWMNAGDHQFGPGAVLGDVSDAVRWATGEGIADSRRVAIMGGSFGGYATLCGLAFTPELYACGVDIVGPSNLKTLIESFPPYWAARRQRWLNRMGNVIENDSLNHALSPLFHVDTIRAPLLIGHGANDPRAKLAESEQMVKALRAAGREVTFVVYTNEGHGFQREENATDFSARMERFLAKHLGGRSQPETKVEGTTAEGR